MAYKLEQEPGFNSGGGIATADETPDRRELPVLPGHVVEAALRRLAPEELNLVLKHKLVPTAWLPHRTYFATAAASARDDARDMLLTTVGRVRAVDYRRAVRRALGEQLLQATTLRLHRQSPTLSNRFGPSIVQKVLLATFFAATLLAPFALPAHLARLASALPIALIFLGVVSLRLLCLMPHRHRQLPRLMLFDDELPTYSVLVPLFKETGVLPQLLQALRGLDYPALCIKRTKICESLSASFRPWNCKSSTPCQPSAGKFRRTLPA